MLFFIVPSGSILLNHLGRLIKDLGRNRDADLLDRLQVDAEVEIR